MKREIIIGSVIVILAALAVVYFVVLNPDETAPNGAETVPASATDGLLPSLDVGANPLEDAPDTNPLSKTNPFSGVETNPFR